MKKSILNLGKALNKAEQKNVFGGLGEKLTKYDENCERMLYGTEGRCWGYHYPYDGNGSGYYEYSCSCY